MILTIDKLEEIGACADGKKWFLDFSKDSAGTEANIVIRGLLDQKKLLGRTGLSHVF